jgi:hypothetical protein
MFLSLSGWFFLQKSHQCINNYKQRYRNAKSNKNTNRSLDHLTMTIDTSANRKRVVVLALPTPEPYKDCVVECVVVHRREVIVLRTSPAAQRVTEAVKTLP